jgi:glycosyltransferase involved in cell wall biosynthesis
MVDPLDPQAIAEALGHVIDDYDLRRGLAERGRRRARGFSWEKAVRDLISIYEEATR